MKSNCIKVAIKHGSVWDCFLFDISEYVFINGIINSEVYRGVLDANSQKSGRLWDKEDCQCSIVDELKVLLVKTWRKLSPQQKAFDSLVRPCQDILQNKARQTELIYLNTFFCLMMTSILIIV